MNDERADDPTVDRGAAPGADLLQDAARELIGAARLVLDAVEAAVADPDLARGFSATVGDVVRQAAHAGVSFLTPRGPTADDDTDEDGGVQSIKVD